MMYLSSPTLSELYVQVSSTGQLTPIERFGLRNALLDEWTSEDERQAIDRLLYAIRIGRVQVV